MIMKKIAFSMEDNQGLQGRMSLHFGRCPFYAFVDVDGDTVHHVQVVSNPYYGSHAPGAVPEFIRSQGADVMIAGGMGPRALQQFAQYNIEVVTTNTQATPEEVLPAYLRGELTGANGCEHHH
jgi:predicted Fe-Mo cluster-binding NifX family protein